VHHDHPPNHQHHLALPGAVPSGGLHLRAGVPLLAGVVAMTSQQLDEIWEANGGPWGKDDGEEVPSGLEANLCM
jgi:hypothetical protein